MEPDKCTAAQGMDSDEDQILRDSSAEEGEKSDLDQQSLVRERNIYWFTTTLALDYLQPAFVSSIKDEMKRLQEQTLMDFGRQLCAEATSSDIIKASNNMANFRHVCPTEVVACQSLLNVLKGHTTHSVRFFDMLKDTDPQKWLNSPFEFVRLFLEDWLRCNIQDIQECDVTALCNIAMRCKPLMQLHDSTKLDAVRKVRNWAMHRARIQTSKEEMEDNIDVILDFLQHINSFRNSDEVTQAIERIRKLRKDGVRIVVGIVVPVYLGWLQSAKRDYEHKRDEANELHQNIVYIDNELRLLDSGHLAVTKMNEGEEQNIQATIEKLTDENRKVKQKTVDIVKLQEEKQELEKQNEELRKRLCSAEQGEVLDYVRDVRDPPTTGEKADQDQKVLMETRDDKWFKIRQALKYLQPVFVSFVEDKMITLHKQCLLDFGRQHLCSDATAGDIVAANGNMARFKHVCPATVVGCQNILNIFKKHTTDSVNFYQMLCGTDPQHWLRSPFEFARLFLKDCMRSDILYFQEFDITALCTIVTRCKPLRQIFDESKIEELRKVSKTTMFPFTMNQQETEDHIDVILDFLQLIKSLHNTDKVVKAIESIKQLRTGDTSHLQARLIREWLPCANKEIKHKPYRNRLEDVIYMKNKLAKLPLGLDKATPVNKEEEYTLQAKMSIGSIFGGPMIFPTYMVTQPSKGEEYTLQAKDGKLRLETKRIEERRKLMGAMGSIPGSALTSPKYMVTPSSKGDEHGIGMEELSEQKPHVFPTKELTEKTSIDCDDSGDAEDTQIRELECEIQRQDNIICDLRAVQRNIEERSKKLCGESRNRIMTGALLIGGTILTGKHFGIAAAAAAVVAVGIAFKSYWIEHMFSFLGFSGDCLNHLEFSTEEGCRDGVNRLENVIQERCIHILELQRKKHALKEKLDQL